MYNNRYVLDISNNNVMKKSFEKGFNECLSAILNFSNETIQKNKEVENLMEDKETFAILLKLHHEMFNYLKDHRDNKLENFTIRH
jgi:homoserine trans-succinylase